jgi:hypothetical protein
VRSFLRHGGIGVETLDEFDEQAVGAFAGGDGGAGVAALEQRFAGIDAEPAVVLAAAVALDELFSKMGLISLAKSTGCPAGGGNCAACWGVIIA